MFNKFKYLELNRHHLFAKTKKIIGEHHKHEDDSFNNLTEVIFSSALSLFLTYLAETYFVTNNDGYRLPVCKIICLFVAAIIVYCILYVIIRKLYSIISPCIEKIIFNKKTHTVDTSAQRIKELIDDFDNIAFDNLLISKEFLSEIEKIGDSDIETTTFYLHECLYYLKISVNKTNVILHDDIIDKTVNIRGNSNGVDVFRLINAYNLMLFILEEIKRISADKTRVQVYDSKLEYILSFQIQELEKLINDIGSTCNKVMKAIPPIY